MEELGHGLLGKRMVTLVDADERRNRVRIGLADPALRANVERSLTALGVPLAAVVFEQRGLARLQDDPLTNALREKQRPLVGGLLIERMGAGFTLGFLAKLYGGPRGFVTVSHSLPPMGQVAGTQVFQDGGWDPPMQDLVDRIGVELIDPPFGCGGTCRPSDAGFVLLDDDETGHLGWLAGAPGAVPPDTYYGHYTVVGKGVAVCGETVRSVGMMSGELSGEVTATCTGVESDTSSVQGAPDVTTYTCQTVYEAGVQQGDSGGPVFRRLGETSTAELLGVLWGGYDGEAGFSPIANIESQIGSLEVHEQNEPPEVEITAPPDGSNLGGGAFPVAELAADVFDFEVGGACAACTVHWFSGKDGVLGTTPWSDGNSTLAATLGGGPGYRAVTATVYDPIGQSAWDTIVLSSGNSAPGVSIDWPPQVASLYRDVPYQLQGSSFDAEKFSALPCADLTWTVTGPSSSSFPRTGCFPIVTFESAGTHVLTLDGVDAGSLHGSDVATITVVDPPAAVPPIVTFLSPPPGSGVTPSQYVHVVAKVTDPGGSGAIGVSWWIETPALGFLGTETVTNGGSTFVLFRPIDHLALGCGTTVMTIRLFATDQDAQTGQGTLQLVVVTPPC
jgi:hypothetical protein